MAKNKSKGKNKIQAQTVPELEIRVSQDVQTETNEKVGFVSAQIDDSKEEELIPLEDIQDLSAEEGDEEAVLDEDAVPIQKVTKNNEEGLLAALKEIKCKNVPWVEHLSITSSEPLEIKDIHNDLDRELAFYKQALGAAKEAQKRFKSLGLPFSRPDDFFAEMVKSDEHMNKVRQKIVDETQSIKASENARKQRELKKFGKQIQVEKIKERHLQKRQELDKIKTLKRKLKGGDSTEDFNIDLDDSAPSKRTKTTKPNSKRLSKDAKFGLGGKKRWAKSNTRESTQSINDGFDSHKNASSFSKGKGKHGQKPNRPGKSRRHGSGRK